MERNKKTLSLFILLLLLLVCKSADCPRLPKNPTCYSDYNKIITCLWNSKYVCDDTACTIHAHYKSRRLSYSASCHLKPFDVSRPTLKKCSLIFENTYTDPAVHKKRGIQCGQECEVGLKTHLLRYEARVRVRSIFSLE